MGILLRTQKFRKVDLDNISDEKFHRLLKEIDNNNYSLLDFYKDVLVGKVSWQYQGGFEQLQKDVIERYGEKRVKEYLESQV